MKINKLQIFVIASAVLILGFSACKSNKEIVKTEVPEVVTPKVEKKASPNDIKNVDFKTLSANFSTEVGGIGISGQLRTQKDKTIWISVSKIIELARVKLTPDSVYVSVKIPSQAFQGTYAEFQKDYGFAFNFDIVQALFLGNDLNTYNTDNYTVKTENQITEFTFTERKSKTSSPTLQQVLKMDAENSKIVFNQMKTTSPSQLIEIEYSNFVKINKSTFPQQLKVKASSKATGKVSAEIMLTKHQLNQQLTFPISISKRASKLNF